MQWWPYVYKTTLLVEPGRAMGEMDSLAKLLFIVVYTLYT